MRGRTIGTILLALAGVAGCASMNGRSAGNTPPVTAPTPVLVDPSQIFNDGSQSP